MSDRSMQDVPSFLAAALRHPVLSKDEERRIAEVATSKRARKHRRLEARNELVLSNLRFVLGRAIKFARRPRMHDEVADAFQDGIIGEIESLRKFDPGRGYRLSTYASWWVRHHMSRSHEETGRVIRIPTHAVAARTKIDRAIAELHRELDRPPTVDEIAEAAGLDPGKVEQLLTSPFADPYSLDAPVSDEDGRTFGDMVADETEDPNDWIAQIDHEDAMEKLREALALLTDTERAIIDHRFMREKTLVETAKAVASLTGGTLSRERIRQIQEQALAKLRRVVAR